MANTKYENVVFRKKDGTLTLSQMGVAFKTYGETPLNYRVKWDSVQKHTLNKASAPKSLLKVTVAAAAKKRKQEEGTTEDVVFQLENREQGEQVRDDMKDRMEQYLEKASKATKESTDKSTKKEATATPPRSTPGATVTKDSTKDSNVARNEGVKKKPKVEEEYEVAVPIVATPTVDLEEGNYPNPLPEQERATENNTKSSSSSSMSGLFNCACPFGSILAAPLITFLLGWIFFCIAAFSCDTFKIDATPLVVLANFGDDDFFQAGPSLTTSYGYWGGIDVYSDSCVKYESEYVDGALKAGRAAGLIGCFLGFSGIASLVSAFWIKIPKGILVMQGCIIGIFMSLLPLVLIAGLFTESCRLFDDDNLCYARAKFYLIIPSILLFIVGSSVMCCCMRPRSVPEQAQQPIQ